MGLRVARGCVINYSILKFSQCSEADCEQWRGELVGPRRRVPGSSGYAPDMSRSNVKTLID